MAAGTGDPLSVVDGRPSAVQGLGVLELVAEAALLQARLDWFQTQLGRLGGDAGGGRHR
ncbi:hypothetical protein OG895_07695 [Streptomyces sp. NBC_00201]|uniref:hypothetical protein n=1 Tax=unclassified Streptomyces TaxID=2593676 RepID=UPI002258ECFD|nr:MULTISPECIES: hypothetical protein [unclassified Streptomyces]MCX5245126.1 hypothetical protein [Streptomyces sp. NBC_00201]MCX5289144.1 hypothetical protein [Streptomyces sp. NBC_00183]